MANTPPAPMTRPEPADRSMFLVHDAGLEILHVRSDAQTWRALHERLAVVVPLVGASEHRYRGRRIEVDGPTALAIEPGELHAGRSRRGQRSEVTVLFLPFDPQQTAATMGLRGPLHFRPGLPEQGTSLPALVMGLARAVREAAPRLEIDTLTSEAFMETARVLGERGAEDRPASPGGRALRRAREMLSEDLSRDLGLDELAAACGVTGPHLVRAFHKEVGAPPFAYRRLRRLARARELLARGTSAAEAAQEVGFFDQSHFHRHFRRAFGLAPGAYALLRRRGGGSPVWVSAGG